MFVENIKYFLIFCFLVPRTVNLRFARLRSYFLFFGCTNGDLRFARWIFDFSSTTQSNSRRNSEKRYLIAISFPSVPSPKLQLALSQAFHVSSREPKPQRMHLLNYTKSNLSTDTEPCSCHALAISVCHPQPIESRGSVCYKLSNCVSSCCAHDINILLCLFQSGNFNLEARRKLGPWCFVFHSDKFKTSIKPFQNTWTLHSKALDLFSST